MLTLPILFRDRMVLQREKPIRINGTAAAGAEVSGTLACGSTVLSRGCAAADANGSFLLELPPVEAARGCTLTVSCGAETRTLHDVAAGEVWMAMGQSNMEYFLRYDADWQNTLTRVRQEGADPLTLRMFNCPQIAFGGFPYNNPGNGVWFAEGEAPWRSFSAPGYHFARTLREHGLDIPLAVIGCNWGGTPAQAWMSEEALQREPLSRLVQAYRESFAGRDPAELEAESKTAWANECSYLHGIAWRAMMEGMDWDEQQEWMQQHASDPVLPMGPWHHYRPSGLYHTMIGRLAPYTVRGFLWYQGESNSGADAAIYKETMEGLVACLRETWQDADTPFYFVQLAPFSRWLDCTADGYAVVRAQQEAAAQAIPHSAVTNVMDLGEHDDIHPKHKKEVGQRLAALALQHTYGQEAVTGEAPVCTGLQVLSETESGHAADHARATDAAAGWSGLLRIVLSFGNCGTGLTAQRPFAPALRLYTKEPDSHAQVWAAGDNSACTQDYFSQQTGFDYHHPIPVQDAVAQGSTIRFTAQVDRPDAPLLVSFAESDWCEVTVHSSYGIPVRPFHIPVTPSAG